MLGYIYNEEKVEAIVNNVYDECYKYVIGKFSNVYNGIPFNKDSIDYKFDGGENKYCHAGRYHNDGQYIELFTKGLDDIYNKLITKTRNDTKYKDVDYLRMIVEAILVHELTHWINQDEKKCSKYEERANKVAKEYIIYKYGESCLRLHVIMDYIGDVNFELKEDENGYFIIPENYIILNKIRHRFLTFS